jgi:MFS family permease
MNKASRKVQRTYLTLLLLYTLAASLIWGINTLFLLDAGLNNTEAFMANAFFTLGFMIFEIPTGVIADLRGRRMSYLLGVITLILSTLLYLFIWYRSAPFWGWALSSILLGLGFTFFSGAMEAWLVDALGHSGYKDALESVLAKGEIVEGAAMLTGSVAGGIVAQATNLGTPYVIRAALLVLNFVFAFLLMRDLGFKPADEKNPIKEVKTIIAGSVRHGLRNPPVRWIMLAAPFTGGITIYAFYAMQPYLLQLWGNEKAYAVAGLAAAIVAGAQIAGGLLVPHIGRIFGRRTTVLLTCELISVLVLAIVGFVPNFWAG